MPRHRSRCVFASISVVALAAALAISSPAAAQPPFTAQPVADIEPTGDPWIFPCTIPIPVPCPQVRGAAVDELTALQGRAVFRAFDFDHGLELWVTDGLPDGTHRLSDLAPGPLHSRPEIYGRNGDELIFKAFDGDGQGLWATDGVELRRVGDVALPDSPVLTGVPVVDGWLYFKRGTSEVWRTDGVVIEPASSFPQPGNHLVRQVFGLGSRVLVFRDGLFSQHDELHEIQPSSAEVLRSCEPADTISGFATFGGAAYFGARCVAGLPDLGPGLFRTDATTGGVERIATLEGDTARSFLVTAGALYFVEPLETSSGVVSRIWRSDGTPAGTMPMTGFDWPWIWLSAVVGDRYLLFDGTDLPIQSLDLTTGAVADLSLPSRAAVHPAPSGSVALVGGSGGWWLTDGTPEGTLPLLAAPWSGRSAAFLGDRALFGAADGVQPADLWAVGLPGSPAIEIPALGRPGAALLALLLAAAASSVLMRRERGRSGP